MNRIQLTPDNSNLPQLEVIFASLLIISISFSLDNSNYVLSAWKVGEKKTKKKTVYWNPRHWIQLKTTVSFFCPPLFFVTQIQCPCIPLCHIKRCCLIPCSQYQSLFLAAFEVKYAWYLRSFPIRLLISSYLFRTHDNSNFSR